jgi:hypothetical protein
MAAHVTVESTVTVEYVDPLGQRGHFVKVARQVAGGHVVVDWYTRESALSLAQALIRAAQS